MQVSIFEKDGNSFLKIEVPVSLRPSKSGKTTVIATSSGNQTFSDITFDGKPVTVGVNAYVPRLVFRGAVNPRTGGQIKKKGQKFW